MRLKNEVVSGQDRLSDEELIALRARLREARPDVVPTVDTIAEALGRSREEVLVHLEQLRAERAFAEGTVPGPTSSLQTQRRLLYFALFLFCSAGAIYKLTPRPVTQTELEARLAEMRAKRARGPKHVSYPIKTNLVQTEANRTGLPLTLIGQYTRTEMTVDQRPFAVSVSELQRRYRENFIKTYETARDAEEAAPTPPQPLKYNQNDYWQFGGQLPSPDVFLGTGIGQPNIPSHLKGQELQALADRLTNGYAEVAWKQQVDNFKRSAENPNDAYGMTPISMQLSTPNLNNVRGALGSPLILPQDPVTVRKALIGAVRGGIRSMVNANKIAEPLPGARRRDAISAVDVRLDLPNEPLTVHVPLTAKDGFPNAAEAWRAGERALAKLADQIEARIRQMNKSVK